MADDRADDELLRAWVQGDQGASGAFVECHQNVVFSFLYRRLLLDHRQKRGDLAADLTQEVIRRAYRMGALPPGMTAREWLCSLAAKVSTEHGNDRPQHD